MMNSSIIIADPLDYTGFRSLPDRDFPRAIDFASGNVVGNAIHPDGTLTAIPGSPFGPGANSTGGEVNSVITFPPPACPTVASTE